MIGLGQPPAELSKPFRLRMTRNVVAFHLAADRLRYRDPIKPQSLHLFYEKSNLQVGCDAFLSTYQRLGSDVCFRCVAPGRHLTGMGAKRPGMY